MGLIEAIVLWISFLVSTGGNVYLYGQVEEYKTKYEQAQQDADICGDYKSKSNESRINDVNDIKLVESELESIQREYDSDSRLSLEQSSELCDTSIVGDNLDGLLRSQERFLEELRKSRLYTRKE